MNKQDAPAIEHAVTAVDEASATGELESSSVARKRSERKRGLGIGGKLMLSFGVTASLTVVASGVAWVSFGQTEGALRSITEVDMPAMVVAQELAENSAQLAVVLPAVHQSEYRPDPEFLRKITNDDIPLVLDIAPSCGNGSSRCRQHSEMERKFR